MEGSQLQYKSTSQYMLDIEMEDEEESTSIEELDQKDRYKPEFVVEYVQDIFNYFRSNEVKYAINPTYMSKQPDVNFKMRSILVDWLVEVHYKFRLMPETLYLTVNIIDRFLMETQVPRDKLQLIGVTAMVIASKYEEIYALPTIGDFVYICDDAYDAKEILIMENVILNAINFNLSCPTPFHFLHRYAKLCAIESDKKTVHLVNYLLELTLPEYSMLKYSPSNIVASAIYLALRMSKHCSNIWTQKIESALQYSERTMKPCVKEMFNILNNSTNSTRRDSSIRKKYASPKLSSVSNLEGLYL